MIEFRTFEGGAKELSEFTQRIWIKQYGGKLPIPLWGPAFFDWQLFDKRLDARKFMVAAYDGARLVGMLPCQPIQFDLRGRVYDGSICSWQSVDPEYRRRGIARGTASEQYRRHMEHEMDFYIGYPLAGSIGSRFWADGSGAVTIQKLAFWFRLLDYRAAAQWEPVWWAALGARALGLVQRAALEPLGVAKVRPYTPPDLHACLGLLHAIQRESDLSIHWTEERLRHQLEDNGLSRTIVVENGGQVTGFVNYHLTVFRGRIDVLVATVDFVVLRSVPVAARQDFLKAAFYQMKSEGAALATVACMPYIPWRDMVRAGCLPFPGAVRIVYVLAKAKVTLEDSKRVFLLCR
jgi:GNAT superfamily N-acetyltransferase